MQALPQGLGRQEWSAHFLKPISQLTVYHYYKSCLCKARPCGCQDNQGGGSFPSASLFRTREWEAPGHAPRIGQDSFSNTLIQDISPGNLVSPTLTPCPSLYPWLWEGKKTLKTSLAVSPNTNTQLDTSIRFFIMEQCIPFSLLWMKILLTLELNFAAFYFYTNPRKEPTRLFT